MLRGMELAAAGARAARRRRCRPGRTRPTLPDGFEERLGGAENYILYRVRHRDRARGRPAGGVRARARGAEKFEDSPERQEAVRLAADRLDLPRETLSGIAPARVGSGAGQQRQAPPEPPRILEAGLRLERDTLAACLAHPELVPLLATLAPEHFVDPLHLRFRALLVEGGEGDEELTALRAELGARAERDALDQKTGQELLLRLRERRLRRELQEADLVRATELQAHLAKVRQAIAELA